MAAEQHPAGAGGQAATAGAELTVDDVVAELQRSPLLSVARARRPEQAGGVPAEPGFYSWWASGEFLSWLPPTRHPSEPLRLLYVGIAPRRPTSSATLRSRLLRQHIGGNIGSSTFRLGLASLLAESEGWTPRVTSGGEPTLNRADNTALSVLQSRHLRVRCAVVAEPWPLERDVVLAVRPPMNREHNERHSFYAEMGRARSRLRDASRA